LEHLLSQVPMSFFLQNHCFSFPSKEKGNNLSLTALAATPVWQWCRKAPENSVNEHWHPHCWYFVTSTSEIGSFNLVSVKASEMPGIDANKCLDISYSNYW
jgi:hypothetical protein